MPRRGLPICRRGLRLSRAKRPLRPRQSTTRSFTDAVPVKETRPPRKRPERRAPPSTNPNEDAESNTSPAEGLFCTQDLRMHFGTALTSNLDAINTVVKDPTATLELRMAHGLKCRAATRETRRQGHTRVEKADQCRRRDSYRERCSSCPARRFISSNKNLSAHSQIMPQMQTRHLRRLGHRPARSHGLGRAGSDLAGAQQPVASRNARHA